MSRTEIEDRAIQYVIRYEKKRGYTARIEQGLGCDLVTSDNRYIEVKGMRGRIGPVQIYESVFDNLGKIGKLNRYFIYVVYNILANPRLVIISPKMQRWQKYKIRLLENSIPRHIESIDLKTGKKIKPTTLSKKEKGKSLAIIDIKSFLTSKGASKLMRNSFLAIRKEILGFGRDVVEFISRSGAMYCFYSAGKGLAWFELSKNRMRIQFRKGTYRDEKKLIMRNERSGLPMLYFKPTTIDVQYAIRLLKHAYNQGIGGRF